MDQEKETTNLMVACTHERRQRDARPVNPTDPKPALRNQRDNLLSFAPYSLPSPLVVMKLEGGLSICFEDASAKLRGILRSKFEGLTFVRTYYLHLLMRSRSYVILKFMNSGHF